MKARKLASVRFKRCHYPLAPNFLKLFSSWHGLSSGGKYSQSGSWLTPFWADWPSATIRCESILPFVIRPHRRNS